MHFLKNIPILNGFYQIYTYLTLELNEIFEKYTYDLSPELNGISQKYTYVTVCFLHEKSVWHEKVRGSEKCALFEKYTYNTLELNELFEKYTYNRLELNRLVQKYTYNTPE